MKENFNYDKEKQKGLPDNFRPIIFEKRRCALLIDDELSKEQSNEFIRIIEVESEYKTEILVQEEIKELLHRLPLDFPKVKRLKSKIEGKANKRFVNA